MCITRKADLDTDTHAGVTPAHTQARPLEQPHVHGYKYAQIPLHLQLLVNRVHLKCGFIQFVLVSVILTPD